MLIESAIEESATDKRGWIHSRTEMLTPSRSIQVPEPRWDTMTNEPEQVVLVYRLPTEWQHRRRL